MESSNPLLDDFWRRALAPGIRYATLYGGRMSGKTWSAADKAIALASFGKIRFVCTRQIQQRIKDSVHGELKMAIERSGKEREFRVLNNYIEHTRTGSDFLFYGLRHSIAEVKGIPGIDVTWNEEAEGYSQDQHDILSPTLFRNRGAQMWNIFNPKLATDFVWRNFVSSPPNDAVTLGINYTDNPFLCDTAHTEIEDYRRRFGDDKYRHIYLGQPDDNDDVSIIKRAHCMAAIDAHLRLGMQPSGMRRLGFDVGDSGDPCAIVESHGQLASWSDQWQGKEDELLKSCKAAWHVARERKLHIVYDAIGVGAHAGAKFDELNSGLADTVSHSKFFAGGAPDRPDSIYASSGVKNRDYFANIKAQKWWTAGDYFRNTFNAVTRGEACNQDEMLFLDSNMPNLHELIDQLCIPLRDFDATGKVKVESKADLKKRGIPSPNLADAFLMSMTANAHSVWD